jgi:hypothetical protein
MDKKIIIKMIWWKIITVTRTEEDIKRLHNTMSLWNINIKIDNDIINTKNILNISTEEIRIALPSWTTTAWYFDYDFSEEVLNRLN